MGVVTVFNRDQREIDIAEISALLRLCDQSSVADLRAEIERRVLNPLPPLRCVGGPHAEPTRVQAANQPALSIHRPTNQR